MARGDRRSLFRSRSPAPIRAWLLALGLMLTLSLLPSRWLVGWTAEVADFANVVLTPPKHAFSSLRHWLRPIPDALEAAPEQVRDLERQLEQARTYYKGLEIDRDLLLQRIALLERAKMLSGAGDLTRTVSGTVIGVTPPSGRSGGSLQLNVGTMHGVIRGMIATWDGDMLVGRVADSVQRFTSTIVPATSLPGFTVRFFPPDREIPAEQAPRGVLVTKEGLWTVDLTQPGDIAIGWVARVAEERWPRAALGIRVGVVETVAVRDDAPLMRRITLRPMVDALRVPHVVLTDERNPPAATGADGGGS